MSQSVHSSVAAAIGPQSSFNQAVWWVHILFAVAFSIKSVAGVFMNVTGFSIVGAIAGIIISDITIYLLITSWQKRELVGEQKSWSYALYALAMGDVFLGAIAGNVGWANAMYYSWGMWAMLVGVFVCYVMVAVIVNPAAQADESEKMSNLRMAQAEHESAIADRRNRSDAKLLKAREVSAIRMARWSTMERFYDALAARPNSQINRWRIGRKAGAKFAGILDEIDGVDVSRHLPANASQPAREILVEPSGDGMSTRPPSFR